MSSNTYNFQKCSFHPSVLYVSGTGGHTRRYRVHHMLEALRLNSIKSSSFLIDDLFDLDLFIKTIREYDIVILHRMPYKRRYRQFFDILEKSNKCVLFEFDDLLFDTSFYTYHVKAGQQAIAEREHYSDYYKALEYCVGAICSTNFLANKLQSIGFQVKVVRNFFNTELGILSSMASKQHNNCNLKFISNQIVIGYPSGTGCHDLDFAEINNALLEILSKHDNTIVNVIGPINFSPSFIKKFEGRILNSMFVDWKMLPNLLSKFDICLGPLVEDSDFCQGKSELKWIESGLVSVPCICSRTDAFIYAITDGNNGMLASTEDEWFEKLDILVSNHVTRHSIGNQALIDVRLRYNSRVIGKDLADFLCSLSAYC